MFGISAIWNSNAQDSVRIYGHVTDFNSRPLDSVWVNLKDKNFTKLYEVFTDKEGYFTVNVAKGNYYCLYAIKSADYAKTKLEYWAWNIPADKDLEINPQYDRMEIYGVNAFEPQVSPFESYIVYFRPMSLTKILKLQGQKEKKDLERKAGLNHDTINAAPFSITKEELKVSINDIPADIVNINKIAEYARGGYIYGYLIQILKPENGRQTGNNFDKISIILHSKETDEYGKGEYFIKRIR